MAAAETAAADRAGVAGGVARTRRPGTAVEHLRTSALAGMDFAPELGESAVDPATTMVR